MNLRLSHLPFCRAGCHSPILSAAGQSGQRQQTAKRRRGLRQKSTTTYFAPSLFEGKKKIITDATPQTALALSCLTLPHLLFSIFLSDFVKCHPSEMNDVICQERASCAVPNSVVLHFRLLSFWCLFIVAVVYFCALLLPIFSGISEHM